MALSPYQKALDALAPASSNAVKGAFSTWSADAALAQVSQNVAAETALAVVEFAALLGHFATHLENGNPTQNSWLAACRNHKLKGSQIPIDDCPAVLGRARSLEDHAKSVAKASFGSLTQQEAKRHLLKHSGSLNPIGFEPFLRSAALGNYFVLGDFQSGEFSRGPV